MLDEDCALSYSKCPETIAVEPNSNSLLGKLIPKRRQNKSSKKDLASRGRIMVQNLFPARMIQIPVDHRSNEYLLQHSTAPVNDGHKQLNYPRL